MVAPRVSEIRQAVTRLGVGVIGHDGHAYTILGGSSEIQREIIAKMVLGI